MVYLSFIIKQTNHTDYDCVFIQLYKDILKRNKDVQFYKQLRIYNISKMGVYEQFGIHTCETDFTWLH